MSLIDNNPDIKKVSDKVMSVIKGGQVFMRPKWQFILETILTAAGVAVILLTLIYFISFIIFILRQSGAWFAPAFGARGWFELLFALPWLLIILALICFVVLEILVRRYSFAYRRPVLYSLLGVVVLVLVSGSLVARTSFHNKLWRGARVNQVLPPVGRFYREFGRPHRPDIERGVINEIIPEGFYLKDEIDGDIVKVIINEQTRRLESAELRVGDMIVVMGKKSGVEIVARGVHIINDEFDIMPPPMINPLINDEWNKRPNNPFPFRE